MGAEWSRENASVIFPVFSRARNDSRMVGNQLIVCLDVFMPMNVLGHGGSDLRDALPPKEFVEKEATKYFPAIKEQLSVEIYVLFASYSRQRARVARICEARASQGRRKKPRGSLCPTCGRSICRSRCCRGRFTYLIVRISVLATAEDLPYCGGGNFVAHAARVHLARIPSGPLPRCCSCLSSWRWLLTSMAYATVAKGHMNSAASHAEFPSDPL